MSFSTMLRTLAFTMAALTLLAAAPARAEWVRGESTHFIVYGDVSEGQMREFVRKVERFDHVLRLYWPIANTRESGKLEIFLAHGLTDLRKVSPTLGSGVAGFYTADVDRVFAIVDLSRSEGDHTLFHEYGHHFMLANLPGSYPGWFIEGFAEYYSTIDLTPGRIRVGLHSPGRMNSLTMGGNSWAPMDAVLGSRSSQIPPSQVHSYYAQAWALVNYFMSTPERQQQLGRYLAAVTNGADPIAALEATVNLSPQELQEALRTYLYRINYQTLQQTIPPAEVTVTRLPRSAQDLLLTDLRLDRLGSEGKDLFLTEAAAVAARYPGDRLAAIVTAKVAMHREDWGGVESALQPFVADGANDVDALRLTAIAKMEQGDADGVDDAQRAELYRDAQRLLGRAVQADPTDYRVYLALADNRETAPGYPTENDLNILLAAAEFAPQVTTTRFRAARALVNEGVYRQAIDLLWPIANNPHGGDANRPIWALLNEAREKLGLALLATEGPPQEEDSGEPLPPAEGE